MPTQSPDIQKIIDSAVASSRHLTGGEIANYIPELTRISDEVTAVAVRLLDGRIFTAGDQLEDPVTLQSAAKLVPLIGLIEERGLDCVLKTVKTEPSGDDFASLARLDQFGPLPSNPMLNAGAIALCDQIPGNMEARLNWLEKWMTRLFGTKLSVDPKVYLSEKRTGDRNRSLAFLLKSRGQLSSSVDDTLETYFHLCSFRAHPLEASFLPMLLANKGCDLNGVQQLKPETMRIVVSIMATCGLYNETGRHLVQTGLPAKSSVSGFILAVAPQQAGIAVMSPKVSLKGTSIRGQAILEHISTQMGWHFAG